MKNYINKIEIQYCQDKDIYYIIVSSSIITTGIYFNKDIRL